MRTISTPKRITFETNPDDCNLRCIMCQKHSPYRRNAKHRRGNKNNSNHSRMDPKLIRNVLAELKGSELSEVVTTPMGEPFLYDGFDSMVGLCDENKLKLHVTTNGTFPTGKVNYWAKRLTTIGADIKFSLNGSTNETQALIMRGARFDNVVENIKTFVAIRNLVSYANNDRSKLTLKLTFMASNVNEIPDFVRLAFDVGLDRIRGSHVLSLFPQTDSECLDQSSHFVLLFNKKIEEAWELANNFANLHQREIVLSNFDPIQKKYAYGHCPYLGYEAFIAVDGSLMSCCLSDMARPRITNFGNVSDKGLLSIWNGPEYRDFCLNYHNYAECKKCLKRIIPATKRMDFHLKE